MPVQNDKSFAMVLLPVMQEAGRLIMDIRDRGIEVDRKSDESPVTQADREAEVLIFEGLGRLAPDIPIIGEEAVSAGQVPEIGNRFFLVDPLDGTKEFIAGRSEFTVNIALIEDGRPVFGMVYAPVLKKLYFTTAAGGAARIEVDPRGAVIDPRNLVIEEIGCVLGAGAGLRVVASRSHLSDETKAYLENFEVDEFLSAGSSLKFCLLAAGEADLYPRLSPTMEWDTAAGQAVLEAAGGQVLCEDGSPFLYGKKDVGFLNGGFIARGAIR